MWLQVFLLKMLVSMCVAGNAPGECHPNTAGAALAAARATEVPFKNARLPRQLLATAHNMKSLNLLQATMTTNRKDNDTEEELREEPVVTKRKEKEETPLEKIGEETNLLEARLQLDRGLSLFENARFKLNHVSSHR